MSHPLSALDPRSLPGEEAVVLPLFAVLSAITAIAFLIRLRIRRLSSSLNSPQSYSVVQGRASVDLELEGTSRMGRARDASPSQRVSIDGGDVYGHRPESDDEDDRAGAHLLPSRPARRNRLPGLFSRLLYGLASRVPNRNAFDVPPILEDAPPSFVSIHPELSTAQDRSIAAAKSRAQLKATLHLQRLLWDAGLLSSPPMDDEAMQRWEERERQRHERRAQRKATRARSDLPTYSEDLRTGEVQLGKGGAMGEE